MAEEEPETLPNQIKTLTLNPSTINDLPEHLLLQILSFLPIKDAVQTSFLARKWRHLWTSLPCLVFDQRLFRRDDAPPFAEANRFFADFVDRALILHEGSSITKFRVWFDYNESRYASKADSWIRFAIRNNVEELDLDFRGNDGMKYSSNEVRYDLSLSALTRGAVKVLKLSAIDIYPPTEFCFCSLTNLTLNEIELTDEMVPDLLSGCPKLENLVLDYCYGMVHLKIYSQSLRSLTLMHYICGDSSLEIVAPNLISFTCIHYTANEYYLKDVSNLEEAEVYFCHFDDYFPMWRKVIESIGHVRRLTVQNWWIELMEKKADFFEKIMLSNVKYLHLVTGSTKMELLGVAVILRICPNVETMVFRLFTETDENENYLNKFMDKLLADSLRLLKKIRVEYFVGSKNELLLLQLLLKYAVVLEKMILCPNKKHLSSVLPKVLEDRFKILEDCPRSSKLAKLSLMIP